MLMNFYKYFLKNIELSAICFIKMREKSILMMIMFSIHCLNNCARGYRVFSVCVVWLQSKRVNESKYTCAFQESLQNSQESKNKRHFHNFSFINNRFLFISLFDYLKHKLMLLLSIIWSLIIKNCSVDCLTGLFLIEKLNLFEVISF